ncbi:hypothetical protein GH714_034922 [Hevea brasiliensis]|uniref:PPM-type phosphatase domain-containing protein n=1 Tax=Hevea brasiliensis TaxID=3981 RepID=A0A6A6MFP8_HEVBR|nr:hypothetical protein GH714_034922 [Hevea brasiliensis]
MTSATDVSRQIPTWEVGCTASNGSLPVMEDKNDNVSENLSKSRIGKPPRNLPCMRHCSSTAFLTDPELDIGIICLKSPATENSGFQPIFRSGSCSEKGPKQYMEDEYIIVDNLHQYLATAVNCPVPGAFYGAIKTAFVKADHALADAKSVDSSSGTTALTALILGRTMLIANAGDSRAVLGKRGRAIELSKDHKPNCTSERLRIERLGGVIYDGYLNGQLSVARALGDWHIKVTIVRKELMIHNDPERCSKALVKEALQRNTCDNLTVIVVCFSPDPPPKIEMPRSHKRRSISAEGLDILKGVLNNDI